MLEKMDPKTLVRWLLVAAIVYLVLPYDLIPDFFGLPGRLDDLLMMAWLAWFYRSHVRQYVAKGYGRPDANHRSTGSASPKARTAFDPYQVLGVDRSASREAIRTAYRSRMQEYHPDKVAHLGSELQALAHEKSQEIQRAYRELGA